MPRTTINVDLSNPQFSGFLTKQSMNSVYVLNALGMWLKDWRKRYFVLKGNKLYFSKGINVLGTLWGI